MRWAISSDLRLIARAFDVTKPYYDLNAANLLTRLGEVRHLPLGEGRSHAHIGSGARFRAKATANIVGMK